MGGWGCKPYKMGRGKHHTEGNLEHTDPWGQWVQKQLNSNMSAKPILQHIFNKLLASTAKHILAGGLDYEVSKHHFEK